MNKCRIIIFAKAPIEGKVKTRLIGALGAQKAAQLARIMLLHTLKKAIQTQANQIELRAEPEFAHKEWHGIALEDGIITKPQGDGDLGQKMARAAKSALDEGEFPILIGTDCPSLNSQIMNEIIGDLVQNDCVMIPAFDGGYVLLALRKFDASIFENIEWGTSEVAEKTIGKIHALGFSLMVKEPLADIDNEDDLQILPQEWLA